MGSSETCTSKAVAEMKNTASKQNNMPQILLSAPRTTLLAFALMLGVLSWFALRFEINASAETLVDEENPYFKRTQQFDQVFKPEEFLLIAYQPIGYPLFSERTLDDIAKLSAEIESIDRVDEVRSILNVPLLSLAGSGLDPNLDPDEWTLQNREISMSALADLFSGHPIFEDLLVNEEQTATSLQITFKRNPELSRIRSEIADLKNGPSTPESRNRIAELEEEAAPIEKDLAVRRQEEVEQLRAIMQPYADHANLYLGGEQALAYQLIEIIRNDLLVFGTAIAIAASLCLLLLFQSLRWVLIPAITCSFSVICTLGIFALLGLKGTVISANFVSLQIVLTLAIVIHLIVQYREEEQDSPRKSAKSLAAIVLAKKAGPCFYSALTTSIGFASLMFSGIQPVNTFGLMMVLAMFLSTLAGLALLPLIVAILPDKKGKGESKFATRTIVFFQRTVTKSPRFILTISAVIFIVSIFGAFRLSVENSFINYFRKSTLVHQELSFVDQHMGGSTPLDIIYDLPPSEDVALLATAADIQKLQQFQARVENLTGVGKALSIVNFTQLAKTINGGRPLTEYELSAAYHTIDDSLKESLLESFYSPQTNQARVSIRIADATPDLNRFDLIESIHSIATKLEIDPDQYKLSNLFVIYQDLLQSLYRSQALTLGIVMVAVFACFLAIFKSFKIASASMIPNLLSTALVLGVMGWFEIELDFMTMTIASVAMGISVDDTIHYVHRFREQLLEGATPVEAIERSHRTVGYAMLYTTIIVVSGFSLLAFSDFTPSVYFGLLTALSISIALVSDLVALPAALLFLPAKS